MLADFGHRQPLPYQSLIAVLNRWISMVEVKESNQHNLSLILEWDDEIITDINDYLKTGDLEKILDFWLPYGSLEMLEFFSDLRKIKQKIISINQTSSEKIIFEIIGGEVSNLFNEPKFLKQSKLDGSKYFVSERDSLSANKIIRYLNKNPNQKALIFYGNAHLIKNYVNKNNIANAIKDEDSYGYYLAYYLKQAFGDDSVFSVNQAVLPSQVLLDSPFSETPNQNIFVYSKHIPWERLKPKDYDAFIIRHEVFTPEHPLSLIFSRRVVEKCIEKMKILDHYLPGFQAKRYYNIALNSLIVITSKNFNTTKEWENWYKINGFDGLERLDSEEFAQEIFNDYYKNYKNFETRQRLFMLGFSPAIMNAENIPDSTYWKEKIWPEVLPNIKLLNSIGINSIGFSDEKKKVKDILHSFKDEVLPHYDYLKYWRKYFHNTNY